MARRQLREQAIKLRLQGFTYNQIKRDLGLSKSTLSDWLSKISLTPEQQLLLLKSTATSKEIGREKYRITRANQRITRLQGVLQEQESKLLPLTEKELFIAGLFLYWGEGSKKRGILSISNSNPQVIKFALYWMIKILKVPREKIKIVLHLYADMNIKNEVSYWSNLLDIPIDQFRGPYLKKSNLTDLTYKSFGHGTCNINVLDVVLSERIAMSIKGISDYYGEKSESFWYN